MKLPWVSRRAFELLELQRDAAAAYARDLEDRGERELDRLRKEIQGIRAEHRDELAAERERGISLVNAERAERTSILSRVLPGRPSAASSSAAIADRDRLVLDRSGMPASYGGVPWNELSGERRAQILEDEARNPTVRRRKSAGESVDEAQAAADKQMRDLLRTRPGKVAFGLSLVPGMTPPDMSAKDIADLLMPEDEKPTAVSSE